MNKSNNWLYLILMIASLMACGLSFCFPSTERGFTLLSSIGCSGIVSVLVAWLLERSNEKIAKTKNKEILSCLLIEFDAIVRIAMQRALVACAKINTMDLNKKYSILEICTLLEKTSSNHVLFKAALDAIRDGLRDVPVDLILQFEQGEDGIRLHVLFTRLKQNLEVFEWIENEDNQNDMLMLITVQSFHILEDIYLTRNIENSYSIPEQSKKYINSFRTEIARRKVVE